MKPEYRHQCRYCSHCVCGDVWWCDEKSECCHNPKRPNRCTEFLFNEIPADDCSGNRVYNQRKKKEVKFIQPKLFLMPTDKKKGGQQMSDTNKCSRICAGGEE
jgi:hypothetical protein